MEAEDFVTIKVSSSIDTAFIDSVIWKQDGTVVCEEENDLCLSLEVNLEGVTEYCVTITDNNG